MRGGSLDPGLHLSLQVGQKVPEVTAFVNCLLKQKKQAV